MATEKHDGHTKPIVETDPAIPRAHREQVLAVGVRDDGDFSPIRLDNSNQLKTAGSGGGGGGGACTIAEGADVTEGSIADAAVVGDTSGTISAKLRGLSKILNNVWDSIGGFLKVSDGGGTLSVDDGGGSLTIDGAVAVSNFPAVQPVDDNGGSLTVDGTVDVGNFPAVQPVSDNGGSLTVDGTVAVTDGGGSLTVDGPLTDAQLRATAVPISDDGGSLTVDGTVAVTDGGGSLTVDGPLTDAQLRAAVVPIGDGGGSLTVDGTVAVSSSALPSGASTEATLALIKAKTDNIDVALSTRTKPADQQHVILDSGTTVVTDGGGSLTVDGTVAVTDGGGSLTVDGTVSVDDGGGSITVDGPLTDAQLRAAVVPISDGGGSLTVDGTVAVSGTVTVDQVDTASLDYDTGAGTVNQTVLGIALPGSGGPVAGGTATNPVRTDPTGTTAQPVTDGGGTVSVDDGGGTISIDDGGGSITIDNANLDAALSTLLTTSDFDSKIGSLTEVAPASDTASSGLNGRLQRIAQRLSSLIALVPAALTGSGNFKVSLQESNASQAVTNANLDAGLSTLLTTSDFDTKIGSLTETAPASDTASSGLNGRLQRIAQRLTSLIALVPAALVGGRFDINIGSSGISLTVGGAAAHDAGVSGNPVRIAGRGRSSDYTTISNDDTADALYDLNGKQIVLLGSIPENFTSGKTTDITGTADTQIIAAPAANIRLYVTHLLVMNSHATVSTWVDIEDGTSAIYTVYAPAAGGGASITLPTPLRLTAATALQAKCATTGANVRVSAVAYKAP
jgi:hypothetical protein